MTGLTAINKLTQLYDALLVRKHALEETIYERAEPNWDRETPMDKEKLERLLDVNQDSDDVCHLYDEDFFFANHSWDVGSWHMLVELMDDIQNVIVELTKAQP